MAHTELKPGWMERVFHDASVRVRAQHKLWHMTVQQQEEWAKDFDSERDCPIGKHCSFNQ